MMDMVADGPKMVKVEMVAEQGVYSFRNPDGTHTRRDYVRGQIFEMDEEQALAAAEGEAPKPLSVEPNSSGTLIFFAPAKAPGLARASVRILGGDAPVSRPVGESIQVPAPEPKPADLDAR